jgi:hypothetical protein
VTIIKTQVVAALAELRVNRSRLAADRHIRTILRMFGNGANSIDELSPDFYFHVFCAAGGAGHVCAPRTNKAPAPPAPSASKPQRVRSPLTLALEAELAKVRAKTKRSVPNYVVNVGSPAHFGDEDAMPDYPSDGRKVQ